jgi:hypothetical protein
MPIDPSIPLQVQPMKLESPVNQLAMMGEAMKIGEINRGIEEQNRLNQYLQGADLSAPSTRQELMKYGKTGLAYGKALGEQEKTGLESKKLGMEVTAKDMEIQREKLGNLAFNPSNENIQAHLQDSVLQGKLTPQAAQQQYAQVANMPPAQRKQYFTEMGVKTEERYKMNTMSANQQAQLGQSERHFQIGQQGAGQALTDASGNVTVLDKQGNVMRQLGNIGKPSATFEKTAALQKQQGRDLGLAITELESATKDKGLIDQSTGSGAGRLADVAAGFIGQSTPGAIAIAKLKPIADMALKMVPRFEGPQSDKDTASYKEAAGQLADSSLPTDLRKAAGKEVLRLMKARKNQFVNEGMAAEGIGAGGPALPPGFTADK